MARRNLLLAVSTVAAAFMLPSAAGAGVTVLGAGNARMCYLSAVSEKRPWTDALKRCDAALQEEHASRSNLVATHVNRGILRLRMGDTAGALADFDAATALNPEEPEAYLNRASTLLRQEQVPVAISQFDAAIAKNTRRPDLAYFGRGVAHEENGNLRAAFRDYTKASELAPSWDAPRRELTRFRVVRN